MKKIFHLDYETRSRSDIKKVGGYRYARDASTVILLAAISRGDDKPVLWDYSWHDQSTRFALATLREAASDPDAIIYAHNAPFEIAISNALWEKTFGFPPPRLTQWRCTAAMARRAAMPSALGDLAKALGLAQQKDKVGAQLIKIFCCPRSTGKLKGQFILPDDEGFVTVQGEKTPIYEAWGMFRRYCRQDVVTEQAALRTLAPFELKGEILRSFQFDLEMNERGFPVNVDGLKKAQKIVEIASKDDTARCIEVSGLGPNQIQKLLPWLKERGYPGDDLQEETTDAILSNAPEEMTPEALEVLRIRSRVAYASVKKIPSMLKAACDDNRVRGCLMWSGAIRTHRWTGKIVQPQNFKRPSIKNTHEAYAAICDGWDHEMLGMVFGNPVEVVASSIRHFIHDPDFDLLDADFSNIEARITPWLAGEEPLLQAYRDGRDPYCELAAKIFDKPDAIPSPAECVARDFDAYKERYSLITKDERFVGKQGVLACIAEGSLVLTETGLIPIEKVSSCNQLWDGVEWVNHEGVIYKGEKEVVTYWGITATPDHQIFVHTEKGIASATLRGATELLLRPCCTGFDRYEIRSVDADRQDGPQNPLHVCECSLRVRERTIAGLQKFAKRDEQTMCGLSALQTEDGCSSVASTKDHISTGPLYKPQQQSIQALWREGDQVQLPVCQGSRSVGDEQLGFEQGAGNRQGGQQRPLRTREPQTCNPTNTDHKQAQQQDSEGFCVHCGGVALQQIQHPQVLQFRDEPNTDSKEGEVGYKRETQRMAKNARLVSVYDIVNAGPRHRFTVSGLLVHNCGFQVGGEKLQTLCAKYGRDLDIDLCDTTVEVYREENPAISSMWKLMSKSAIMAVEDPGQRFRVRGKISFGMSTTLPYKALIMRLPSGHQLIYPKPAVSVVWIFRKKKYATEGEARRAYQKVKDKGELEDGDRVWSSKQITFFGMNPITKKWGRQSTYGGKLLENAVQATAGDFISHGALKAADKGYEIFMLIHDQALAPFKKEKGNTVEGFREALCDLPPWASDFPLEATCDVQKFYTKD